MIDKTISKLVDDLKLPKTKNFWFLQYWGTWGLCFLSMAALTVVALTLAPQKVYFPESLGRISYWLPSILWLGFAIFSAMIGYQSAYPGRSTTLATRINSLFLFLLLVGLVIQATPSVIAGSMNELTEGFHLSRAPCGIFILSLGMISAIGMFFVLKRAAPTRLNFTGFWAATSMGAIASFMMNLVCPHESASHVFLWHITPLLLLGTMGMRMSTRLLRW